MNKYFLRGENITSVESLCQEFAAAVEAPEGYFGKCLQSFDDCLFGGFGLDTPCKVIWKSSGISKKSLNSHALEAYCSSLLENSPHIDNKDLDEGTRWVNSTLITAQSGTRTGQEHEWLTS